MTARGGARRWAVLAVLAASAVARPAHAIDSVEAKNLAQKAIDDAERRIDEVSRAATHARPRAVSAPERVAAGDIMLRTHNYERAIQLFSQVLELRRQGKATENEAADAEVLLTESYFQDGQLHSARRHARTVLEAASRPAYGAYSGRALSRLVDVAWAAGASSSFLVAIQVDALDRSRLLADITQVLSDQHVNILSAHVTTNRERVAKSRFTFEMADPAHLEHVLKAVRKVDGVFDVFRVDHS